MFDPDFGKTGLARKLLRLRFRRLELSQRAFAERFGLPYQTVRDMEQRGSASAALTILVEAIRINPGLIERAARNVADDPDCLRFVDGLHG